ncbi:hypothetical protein ACLB2K_028960 [Fragaria x ananassa]
MIVPLDFIWIKVEIQGLLAVLAVATTTRLVAETIDIVLQVDNGGFQHGLACVCLTLPLHQLVRLERQIRVFPVDFLMVQYKYERLLGRCQTCEMINHGGEVCRMRKSLGVLREREEELVEGKHTRHALALVPLPLNPDEMGFLTSDVGALRITKTEKSPK